jgi:hypothetical protein
MSSRQCQAGDNQGFPLTISQKLYSEWPGIDFSSVSTKLKTITVPCEYSVQWPTTGNYNTIRVLKSKDNDVVLQVTGLDPYTDKTTMTYGNASYKCSNVLSIVQNQHKFFSNDTRAQYEVILSFQIKDTDKNSNPSSPHVILFCRPLVISPGESSDAMWNSIDKASSTSGPRESTINLSSIYSYNSSILLPFITYQTCIPTKIIANTGETILGSIRMSVNVITEPLRLNFNSTDLSTSVTKYTLPLNLATLFEDLKFPTVTLTSKKIVQFKDGIGTNGFPVSTTKDNLKISFATPTLTDFNSVINRIKIHVPEAFLGKSFNDLSTSAPPKTKSKNRPYKCYTVDPTKDIVDGQIMIDPTTGERLSDAQLEEELGDSYDIETDVETGIMPGDVEYVLSVITTVLGTLGLLGYLIFIILKGREVYNTQGMGGIMNNVVSHIAIFLMILGGLIAFSILVVKPAKEKKDS